MGTPLSCHIWPVPAFPPQTQPAGMSRKLLPATVRQPRFDGLKCKRPLESGNQAGSEWKKPGAIPSFIPTQKDLAVNIDLQLQEVMTFLPVFPGTAARTPPHYLSENICLA